MSHPSTSMLNNATFASADRNEMSSIARDMFKFVQNNYNFNMEELHDLIKYFLNAVPQVLAEIRKNNHSSLSTTSEKTGADGSDTVPQPASTYHTPEPSISKGDLVDITDIVPRDLSSLPVSSIADLYTLSMLKCLVGYPLYEPEPFSELSTEYMRHGVNVGDVGYVRGDGTFDFLFNICPTRNSLINPPMLADGFSLEASECSGTRAVRSLPHKTHLFRRPIKRSSSGEYICEGSDGAILELPEGAIQHEAITILPFKNLAARYGLDWYKYAIRRGREISNGSLYLITSFTKCTQWGIAVLDQPCTSGEGLTFGNVTSFPFSLWKSSSKYCWRGSNTSYTRVADHSSPGDTPNQCVFLRGYKIMIRQEMFDGFLKDRQRSSSSSHQAGISIPVQATRQKASRIRGGGGSEPILGRLRGSLSTQIQSGKVALRANFNSSLIHPSDLINAALLSQNSGATVALTHDNAWCDLLRDNFPTTDSAVLIKIAQSYTSAVDEYSCISLEKISGSNHAENPATRSIQNAIDESNPDAHRLPRVEDESNLAPVPSELRSKDVQSGGKKGKGEYQSEDLNIGNLLNKSPGIWNPLFLLEHKSKERVHRRQTDKLRKLQDELRRVDEEWTRQAHELRKQQDKLRREDVQWTRQAQLRKLRDELRREDEQLARQAQLRKLLDELRREDEQWTRQAQLLKQQDELRREDEQWAWQAQLRKLLDELHREGEQRTRQAQELRKLLDELRIKEGHEQKFKETTHQSVINYQGMSAVDGEEWHNIHTSRIAETTERNVWTGAPR